MNNLKEELKEFVLVVRDFCLLVENHLNYEKENFLHSCRKLLSQLYLLGLSLPDIECDKVDYERYGYENWLRLSQSLDNYLGEINLYYEIVNPCEKDEASPVTISNDLSEIVENLKPILVLFENNSQENIEAAIWEWRFSFWHWGDHILSVLRPIHELLTQDI